EDLTQVKDNLDVFVRSENRDPQTLIELSEKLVQMGDTLDMLGFGEQRMLLQDQIAVIKEMGTGQRAIEEPVLMDIAGALLTIESALSEPTSTTAEERPTEGVPSEDSIISQFGDPEQRKLVKRVVDEVKVDLSKVKESFNDYSRMPKNIDVLQEVPSLLDRIRGSLSMLTLTRASNVLHSASKYVQTSILNNSKRPEAHTLDLLADAISSVEYYLESLTESWGHPTAILDVAENSLAELGVVIGEEAVAEPAQESLTEKSDDEQTLVDIQSPEFEGDDDKTLVDIAAPEGEFAESGLDLGAEDTEPEIDIASMQDESELSGEFSLEGYDEASDAVSPDSVSDDVQEPYAAAEPNVEGSISQEFNLPAVENTDATEKLVESESEPAPAAEPEPTPQMSESVPASGTHAGTIADELDDEIVEIFLEEAEEEHSNISRLLPKWQNNQDDEETLKDLRRSFHTLKGSGRLVGAADVGEFAWSYENMLNRVIDTTIEPTQEMFDLLYKARDSLPGLLELFKTGAKPGQEIFTLMDKAEALSKGETISTDDFSHAVAPEQIESGEQEAVSNEIELQSEEIQLTAEEPEELEINLSDEAEEEITLDSTSLEPEDTSNLSDINAIDLGADDVTDVDLYQVEIPEEQSPREQASPLEIEGIELEVDDEALSLDTGEEQEPSESGLYLVGEDETAATTPSIDPVLLGIYRKEIATHLIALREYIDNWNKGEDHSANLNLIRAFHTLKGSSRTASVPQVAELCGFLEEHVKYLHDNNFEVDSDLIDLFEETGAFVAETVEKLDEADTQLPENTDLIKRTRELLDKTRYESPTMQIQMPETMQDISLDETSLTDEAEEADQGAIEIIGEEPDTGESEAAAMEQAMSESIADMDYDEELLEIFLEEGVEILDESDHTLHDWIESPENIEFVKALQRQLHTLKGGARMAGVIEVGDLSHSIETMLTAIVDDQLEVADDMFKALQKAQDSLVAMLETVRNKQHPKPATELIGIINALAKSESYDLSTLESAGDESGAEIVAPAIVEEESVELEMPAPEVAPELDETTEQPTFDFEEVSEVQPVEEAFTPESEGMPAVAPEETSPAEVAREQQQQAQQRARGDMVRVRSDLLDNLVNFAGEVSIYRSRMEQQTNAFRYNLTELDDTVERFREQLRNFEIEAEAQIQFRTEESGSAQQDFDPLEFDRFTQMQTLSRGMLESLNDLNSLRSILTNLTRESETLLLQQSRVNTDLQEGLMRTRMVPISGQVPRMRRIVRQTSEELGKKVELQIEGADNELDRTVLERIMSPIEHMLRNAIAHGLETPEQRKAAGKNETGTITLSFAREGSDVVINVSDDGAGIDLEAIRIKAIERGLLKPDAKVRTEDLLNIILESGFSTADEVTQIAGRGVGMDVVNNEIKQLGGLLNTKTESGKGTTFSISMPLSLSVTRALMVTVGEDTYAIPLLGVETVERVSREEIARMQSEKDATYHWLENDYQYIHLGSAIGLTEMQLPPEDVSKLPILLVRSGDYRAAIHVDGLIGSREIVVKPVGPQLSTLRGISGATVMGDGSIVLILDLGVLIRLASIVHEVEPEETIAVEQPKEKRVPLIMVVDDSITVRKVTTRLLERNNFKTVSAKDGVDALAQLQEYKPDVMLLDVEMPRMDGFELA
ncbi:MAG: Hpt domain-containing protein, partial [Thioalkalispiraceae bacterium]